MTIPKSLSRAGGHEAPRGVLEGGDEVEEAGAFPLEGLLQGREVRPLLPGGHGEEAGAVGPEGLDGPQVAGGLQEEGASLVQKDLATRSRACWLPVVMRTSSGATPSHSATKARKGK